MHTREWTFEMLVTKLTELKANIKKEETTILNFVVEQIFFFMKNIRINLFFFH